MIDIPKSLEIISNGLADGTGTFSPINQQILNLNQAEMEAANAAEFRNNLWTLSLVFFGLTVIWFLWRIAQQKKMESSPSRQVCDAKSTDQKPPILKYGPSKPTTAKPPSSGLPDQTGPGKLSETVQADRSDSLFSHPDFPYLPKN